VPVPYLPASARLLSNNLKNANNKNEKVDIAKELISRVGIARNCIRCCAERNMIDAYVREARTKGIREHRIVPYVRRQIGCINVLRFDSSANPRCSVPCVLCRKVLIKFDIQVRCILPSGECYVGKMDDAWAPESHLTSGQRRSMKRKSMKCTRRQKATSHKN